MSVFDRRPGLRWAVPAAAGSLILGGALLAPLAASADAGLPPRTAEELLVALQQAEPTPLSGTVGTSADLGLPSLPMSMAGGGALALATGDATVRVWADGPDRQRLALIEDRAETTVVRSGSEAWVWSSRDATADRYVLPEESDRAGHAGDLPAGLALPSTPEQAAQMALAALDPTTEVTTTGVARVAGRDAYELVLTPRDDRTLVARVSIALDAETSVPLRVRVHSTRSADPAVQVGFTSVDLARPNPGLFEFTPPAGATITEHAAPDPADTGLTDAQRAELEQRAAAEEPVVVGEGWSAVAIAALPQDALADLAESGLRAEREWGAADPAATALALLEALPTTSGPWGSGRLLAGTLFSAIVTDDGRVAVGLVGPEVLDAALADE